VDGKFFLLAHALIVFWQFSSTTFPSESSKTKVEIFPIFDQSNQGISANLSKNKIKT